MPLLATTTFVGPNQRERERSRRERERSSEREGWRESVWVGSMKGRERVTEREREHQQLMWVE